MRNGSCLRRNLARAEHCLPTKRRGTQRSNLTTCSDTVWEEEPCCRKEQAGLHSTYRLKVRSSGKSGLDFTSRTRTRRFPAGRSVEHFSVPLICGVNLILAVAFLTRWLFLSVLSASWTSSTGNGRPTWIPSRQPLSSRCLHRTTLNFESLLSAFRSLLSVRSVLRHFRIFRPTDGAVVVRLSNRLGCVR